MGQIQKSPFNSASQYRLEPTNVLLIFPFRYVTKFPSFWARAAPLMIDALQLEMMAIGIIVALKLSIGLRLITDLVLFCLNDPIPLPFH